jgi:hypothetical protein
VGGWERRTGQLEDFGGEVLEDCGRVDGRLGTDAHVVLGTSLEVTVNTTDRELFHSHGGVGGVVSHPNLGRVFFHCVGVGVATRSRRCDEFESLDLRFRMLDRAIAQRLSDVHAVEAKWQVTPAPSSPPQRAKQ